MKKIITSAILFLLLGCVSAMAQLPSAKLKNALGKSVNATSISNDGKPFIVSFFATWCPPCMNELATISKVYDDWRKQTGVKIFSVSVDQAIDEAKVYALFERSNYSYELLLDQNGEFAQAMKVSSIPHMFLFDGNGKLVYTHVGFSNGDEAELLEKIKAEKK